MNKSHKRVVYTRINPLSVGIALVIGLLWACTPGQYDDVYVAEPAPIVKVEAKELTKASASQKAIGQIELYTRQFKGNFMLIVAGLVSNKNDKSVAEVVRKAKDCQAKYYFLEAH